MLSTAQSSDLNPADVQPQPLHAFSCDACHHRLRLYPPARQPAVLWPCACTFCRACADAMEACISCREPVTGRATNKALLRALEATGAALAGELEALGVVDADALVVPADHLTLDKVISAHGVTCKVWRGQLKRLGRTVPVAVKAMQLALDNPSDALVVCFKRELASMLHLTAHCARVCKYYGVCVATSGPAAGHLCIIMHLYPRSLAGCLEDGTALPLPRALAIAADIAAGLTELHALGMVHLDIKPANVLMDKHGRSVLCDFGLARILESTRTRAAFTTRTMQGTPYYMSPEQFDGKGIGPPADVWALGCTLFYMATGLPPWHGLRMSQICVKVCSGLKPAMPATLPERVQRLILACLSHDPAQRPPARVVCEALVTLAHEFSESPAASGSQPAVQAPPRQVTPVARLPMPDAKPAGAPATPRSATNHAGGSPDNTAVTAAEAGFSVMTLLDATTPLDPSTSLPRGGAGGAKASTATEDRVLLGHTGPVYAVGFTRDGRHVITGSTDTTLRLWDVASGACRATLMGHRDAVYALAVTPDSRLAVSGSEDESLRIWELASGTCRTVMTGHNSSVCAVSVASDGLRCVSGSYEEVVRVWDLGQGTCTAALAGHSDVVWTVTTTPDGRYALSGSEDKTVRVWDLRAGTCVGALTGHGGAVRALAVLPSGRHVVSGSADETLRVWDLASGRCLGALAGHSSWVAALAVTPTGSHALSGSWDDTLRLWELGSGACVGVLKGHSGDVNAVDVSPCGGWGVSGSNDKSARVWDLTRPRGSV